MIEEREGERICSNKVGRAKALVVVLWVYIYIYIYITVYRADVFLTILRNISIYRCILHILKSTLLASCQDNDTLLKE